MDKHPPIIPTAPWLLHGADYNPEQWLHVHWDHGERYCHDATGWL